MRRGRRHPRRPAGAAALVAVGLSRASRSCGRPTRDGLGRRVRLHTKGWLPYTLHWELGGRRVALSVRLHARRDAATSTAAACGRSSRTARFVDVTYDWRLRAEKPLLRNLSFLLKPLFEANHRWAMAQGEESLKLELARRRAASDAARPRPAAAGPVTYAVGAALLAGAAAIGGGVAYLVVRFGGGRDPVEAVAGRTRSGVSARGAGLATPARAPSRSGSPRSSAASARFPRSRSA